MLSIFYLLENGTEKPVREMEVTFDNITRAVSELESDILQISS
jgi:hypothetical protein